MKGQYFLYGRSYTNDEKNFSKVLTLIMTVLFEIFNSDSAFLLYHNFQLYAVSDTRVSSVDEVVYIV